MIHVDQLEELRRVLEPSYRELIEYVERSSAQSVRTSPVFDALPYMVHATARFDRVPPIDCASWDVVVTFVCARGGRKDTFYNQDGTSFFEHTEQSDAVQLVMHIPDPVDPDGARRVPALLPAVLLGDGGDPENWPRLREYASRAAHHIPHVGTHGRGTVGGRARRSRWV